MPQIAIDFLQYLFVGGGAVAAVAFLARIYADKWLQGRFDRQLEAFRTEQQKEMEHVRYRINAYFDRAVRLHTVEFEILPEIWRKLFDAFHETQHFCNYGRMVHDLDKMKPVELETFLTNSPLLDYQKEEVRQAGRKGDRYYKIEHYHELARVKRIYYDFTGYFMKNAIFLAVDVEAKLNEVRDIIHGAWSEKEYRTDFGDNGTKAYEKFEMLKSRGETLLNEIREQMRELLQDSKLRALSTQ